MLSVSSVIVTFSCGWLDSDAFEEGVELLDGEALPSLFEDPLPQPASKPVNSATVDNMVMNLRDLLILYVPLTVKIRYIRARAPCDSHCSGKRFLRLVHFSLDTVPFFLGGMRAVTFL